MTERTQPPSDDATGRRAPWTPERGGARRFLARLLVLLDIIAATLAAVAAGLIRQALSPSLESAFQLEVAPTIVLVPVLVLGLAAAGCYRPAGAGLGIDTFRRYSHGTAINVLVLGFVSFAFRLNLSRLYVALVAVLLLTFGMFFRARLRTLLRRSSISLATRVLVAGTDEASVNVARTLDDDVPGGFEVIGYLDPTDGRGSTAVTTQSSSSPELVGSFTSLSALLEEHRPDAVVASTSSLTAAQLRQLYLELEPSPVELIVYPSLVETAARRIDIETVGPLPLLHLTRARMTFGRRVAKRALDIVVASLLTLVSAPLVAIAMIVVKRESPGPAVFSQTRIGLDGDPFTIYKLRTMSVGAEEQRAALDADNEAGPGLFKMRDDPRVTRVGGWLRRYSVDELPQLLNVLRGEMSMVGPRPALPDEVEARADEGQRRLRLKPGLTGFWQVSGRSELDGDEALRLDLYYVENWSLAFDLLILLRTVRAVVSGRGAY